MSIEDKIAIIAITKNGQELAYRISKNLINSKVYIVNKNLDEIVKNTFKEYDYIIFIMATGIVVRSIAKHIKNKFEDPAILVIDDRGQNVISLLSGHIGGANEMTINISEMIEANPVITTATDVNKKASLDMIAKTLNAYIEDFRENVKNVNSLLVNAKEVLMYIDGDYKVDTRGFKVINSLDNLKDNLSILEGGLSKKENSRFEIEKFKTLVVISNKNKIEALDGSITNTIQFIKVIPRDIVVGIGCRKETDTQLLYRSLIDLFDKENIDIKSINKIGSIDIKKDEKAINDLAEKLSVPFELISSKEISKVEHLFDKSDFVKKNVGVSSVSEPVAYILSGGNLVVKKRKYRGITFSIGKIN